MREGKIERREAGGRELERKKDGLLQKLTGRGRVDFADDDGGER